MFVWGGRTEAKGLFLPKELLCASFLRLFVHGLESLLWSFLNGILTWGGGTEESSRFFLVWNELIGEQDCSFPGYGGKQSSLLFEKLLILCSRFLGCCCCWFLDNLFSVWRIGGSQYLLLRLRIIIYLGVAEFSNCGFCFFTVPSTQGGLYNFLGCWRFIRFFLGISLVWFPQRNPKKFSPDLEHLLIRDTHARIFLSNSRF